MNSVTLRPARNTELSVNREYKRFLSQSKMKLRVMSLNAWHGGEASKLPLEAMMNLIKTANPDIIGVQESAGMRNTAICSPFLFVSTDHEGIRRGDGQPPNENWKFFAEKLGFHFFHQGTPLEHLTPNRTPQTILSRFPIVSCTPNRWGVKVDLPNQEHVWIFNLHLAHWPYQPYQLLGIEYNKQPLFSTAAEAELSAETARGPQIRSVIEELKLAGDSPIILTADMNEPSHLDWTVMRCNLNIGNSCFSLVK